MNPQTTLKHLGFNDKEVAVYFSLLRIGPSPVRKIAGETQINRGTTYDVLKVLIKNGLVSYFQKDKHKYFVAEDPKMLNKLLEEKEQRLAEVKSQFSEVIPQLQSIYNSRGEKPLVKFFDGYRGVRTILEDVLSTKRSQSEKTYFAYSSSDIRKYLYKAFPDYTEQRIKNNILVKVIAIGEGGGLRGLDERKWLSRKQGSPTYILLYANKVALISANPHKEPTGVLIEDEHIAATQKLIFQHLWNFIN